MIQTTASGELLITTFTVAYWGVGLVAIKFLKCRAWLLVSLALGAGILCSIATEYIVWYLS